MTLMQQCQQLQPIERSEDDIYYCPIKDLQLRWGGTLCHGCQQYTPDPTDTPLPFLYLNWSGSDEDTEYHCYWTIHYSPNLEQDLKEIKIWTDQTVKTRGDISLTQCGPNMQELEIVGKGHDNRCRWCRSFRTALESRIGKPFRQRGKCVLISRK